jgi:hypothetical protein
MAELKSSKAFQLRLFDLLSENYLADGLYFVQFSLYCVKFFFLLSSTTLGGFWLAQVFLANIFYQKHSFSNPVHPQFSDLRVHCPTICL